MGAKKYSVRFKFPWTITNNISFAAEFLFTKECVQTKLVSFLVELLLSSSKFPFSTKNKVTTGTK
jgi:hypothetical protein